MRLIESFQDLSQAKGFLSTLSRQNIESQLEVQEGEKETLFLVWVYNENDVEKALALVESYKKDPKALLDEDDQQFQNLPKSQETPETKPIEVKIRPQMMNIKVKAFLTKWLILLCVILFFWNSYQKITLQKQYPSLMKYLLLTPLDAALVYDLPASYGLLEDFFKRYPNVDLEESDQWPQEAQEEYDDIKTIPFFRGLYQFFLENAQGEFTNMSAPLFVKIRQGQIWRVFTPCLLHQGLLHILFNMLWLYLLGRQIEFKIGKPRYLAITIIIGIVSNTFQYLMSGPYFLGYSGIICGLAGFIWVRQKQAPWEGYTIQRSVLIFLGLFILGMFVLQVTAFLLVVFHMTHFHLTIANTAHISGAICGGVLAKIPFFNKVRL